MGKTQFLRVYSCLSAHITQTNPSSSSRSVHYRRPSWLPLGNNWLKNGMPMPRMFLLLELSVAHMQSRIMPLSGQIHFLQGEDNERCTSSHVWRSTKPVRMASHQHRTHRQSYKWLYPTGLRMKLSSSYSIVVSMRSWSGRACPFLHLFHCCCLDETSASVSASRQVLLHIHPGYPVVSRQQLYLVSLSDLALPRSTC